MGFKVGDEVMVLKGYVPEERRGLRVDLTGYEGIVVSVHSKGYYTVKMDYAPIATPFIIWGGGYVKSIWSLFANQEKLQSFFCQKTLRLR